MTKNYTLKEDVFSDSNLDEEQKYWLGFLFADGCVSNTNSNTGNPQIMLSLQKRDLEHIKKYKKFMGSNHSIIHEKSGGVRLKFRSQKLAKDLKKFGIIERKSIRCEVKKLQNNRHFWRGVVDGDGSITPNSKLCRLSLYGNKTVLNQWKNFTLEYIDNEMAIQHKTNNTYGYVINGQYAIPILKELYIDQSIALERKERRAISHLTSHDYTS